LAPATSPSSSISGRRGAGPAGRWPPHTSRRRLASNRARVAKLDTEAEPQIAARFGIRGIPTLIAFKGGRETGRQSGALDLRTLVEWVEAHV
jgi:thioredoxin 2